MTAGWEVFHLRATELILPAKPYVLAGSNKSHGRHGQDDQRSGGAQ